MLKNNLIVYQTIKKILPWTSLALILFLINSRHFINSDEGIILNAAWNIINGKKLYFDFFEFIAPGSIYFLVGWWKIFGVSYFNAALLAYLINLSTALGLYLISKSLKINNWKFLAPIIFIFLTSFWPAINHNAFNVAAIIWASYFFILGLEKKYLFFYCGFFSSLSIIFTQHRGIVATTIIIIFIIYLKIKKLADIKKVFLFFCGLIIPLVYLFFVWPPKLLYENLIIFPLKNYPETNFLLNWNWLYCFIALMILTIMAINKTQKDNRLEIVFISCLGLGLLITSLTRADFDHIFQSLTIGLPLLSLSFEKIFTKEIDKQIFYITIICFTVSRFMWPPLDNSVSKNLIKTIRKNCPEKNLIYAGPFLPIIYFETRSLNIIPYSFLITNQQTTEQFNNALAILKKHQPHCIILDYKLVEKFNYNKNNPLDNFIKEGYKIVDNFQEIQILIPK